MTDADEFQYRRDLLVILGAGASHDCLADQPADVFMPPLTKDLATRNDVSTSLLESYGAAIPILDFLVERLEYGPEATDGIKSTSLEVLLAEYISQASSNPNKSQHVTAFRFYLRDLIAGAQNSVLVEGGRKNRFDTLMRECAEWAIANNAKVCFVSFNYDTLLEIAFSHYFNSSLHSESSYLANRHVNVLKPHGSITWSYVRADCTIDDGDLDRDSMERRIFDESVRLGEPFVTDSSRKWLDQRMAAESIKLGEPAAAEVADLRIFSDIVSYVPAESDIHRHYHPVLPAIALPVAEKDELIWPASQDTYFRETIHNGSFGKVIFIGWRGAETHFVPLLDRLVANDGNVLYVTGGSSPDAHAQSIADLQDNLRFLVNRTRAHVYYEGFATLTRSEAFDTFLRL